MFKILSCALLAILFSIQYAFAQPYIRLSSGYGFPFSNGNQVVMDGYPYTGAGVLRPGTYAYEKKGSLYTGGQAEVAVGIWANEKFGVEVAFNQAFATKKYTQDAGVLYRPQQFPGMKTNVSTWSEAPSMFIPAVMFSPLDNVYFKGGLVFPMSRKVWMDQRSEMNGGTFGFYEKKEVEAETSIGYMLGIGAKQSITKHLLLSEELTVSSISFKILQTNLIESIEYGRSGDNYQERDWLPTRDPEQKQVNYVDGSPFAAPYKIPFGSVAFKIGLVFKL